MPVSPLQQWLIVGWYHPYRLLRMQITGATSASFGSSSEHHLNNARAQRLSATLTRSTIVATAALCLLVFVGCTRERARLRYTSGLQPVPSAEMVTQSTKNQQKIIEEFKVRAGLIPIPPKGSDDVRAEFTAIPPKGSDDWAVFIEAGFNFIDEECNQYLDSLFWFDRYRRTTQNQIAITGATTAAIMGIAGAAAEAIAATATAFGFLTATADNFGSSVLYELEPSGIKTLVDRSRAQYRSAAQQRIKREEAKNQPAAMSLIQGYLALCLPASIETQINGAIVDTNFTEDETAGESLVPKLRRVPLPNIEATISPELQANIERAIRREPQQADKPLPPTPPARTSILGAAGPVEKALSLSESKAVQEALCIEADGNFGDKTREAIALYYAANDRPNVRVLEMRKDATDLIMAGPCKGTPYRNAYERFELGRKDSKIKMKDLQERINIELQRRNLGNLIKVSMVFDDQTREAIKRIQVDRREPATGEIRPELNDEIGT